MRRPRPPPQRAPAGRWRTRGGRQRSRAGLSSSVSAVQLGQSGAAREDAGLPTSASLPAMHAAPTQPEPANGRRAARQQASVGKAPGKAPGVAPARKAPARTASLGPSASAPHAAAPHAAAPTVQTLPLASRGLSRADLRTWESRERMLAARSYHNEWTVRHKQRSVSDMATLCSSADAIAENARRARGGDARVDRRKEEALREIAERGLLKAYEADGVEMGEQRVVGQGGVKVRVVRVRAARSGPGRRQGEGG